jgi:hypothetical protein
MLVSMLPVLAMQEAGMTSNRRTNPGSRKLLRTSDQTNFLEEPSLEEALTEMSIDEGSKAKGAARRPRTRSVECLGLSFERDEDRRSYFLEKLGEKLKDPAFREIEGFPIGSDEDILALSDPPYYTACPNPFTADFIRHYGKPYNPSEPYSREPFAADVSEGKQDPICMAHTYHTKVPYRAIMRYILHYTRPGDVVLDSFAGTGMTGLAAQLCANPQPSFRQAIEAEWTSSGQPRPTWGSRVAILCDLSPFATFLARNFNSDLDADTFVKEATALLSDSEHELGWMYETDLQGSNTKGQLQYAIWTESLYCECGHELLFWHPKNPAGQLPEPEYSFRCPNCDAQVSKRSASRATSTTVDSLLGTPIRQNKQTPVLIEAKFGDRLIKKAPTQFDLDLVQRIDQQKPTHYVPTQPMMNNGTAWGDMFRAGYHFGITHVHHFWTKRNLLVLSDLVARARKSSVLGEMLFLCTSFAVKTGSRMHNVGFSDGKLNLAGQIYNTLQLTSISAERNLYVLGKGKADDIRSVFDVRKLRGSTTISTNSATQLAGVPDNSVDYIFVDPPFGDNIMYSELSFLYEAWLRVFTNQKTEAIMSSRQDKSLHEYQMLMLRAFRELSRVLKPGRWITIAFHNSKNAVWNAIQEALWHAGFVVADVRTLDKGQGTYKQMTTTGAVKQDLVISAYKPNGGLEGRFKLTAGTEEGAWDFVRTHMKQLPVFVSVGDRGEAMAERAAYLLFDRMVAFHVQRGVLVPMSAAEFYAGLKQKFPERDSMFFLSDQVAEYDRRRLTVKEVFQLELAPTDEATAIQWLRQQLERKPQTFQELHPEFTRAIAGWERHEQTLELRDLLGHNFLRHDGQRPIPEPIWSWMQKSSTLREMMKGHDREAPGSLLQAEAADRWYVPDPNKAQDLERLREKGLLKEFEDYRAFKGKQMKVFRLEAVRAGFKKAWQERDYATIIDVAHKIPDAVLQEDAKLLMWYDQALTRSGEGS